MELLPTLCLWVGGLLLLLFSGIPVIFSLGIVAVVSIYLGLGPEMLNAIGRVTWNGQVSYVMASMPLFIFMGYIIAECKISTRIYSGLEPLLDKLLPGGLLHTNIAFGAVFAASSGSSIAAAATIGAISIPEMEKRGYDKSIAVGSVSAGGTLGILIPPSIIMVFYGLIVNESIGKLFLGGIIPGLILTFSYFFAIYIKTKLRPEIVGTEDEIKITHTWYQILISLIKIWPAILFFLVVMGAIYSGLATPTEAAGVGSFVAIIIAGAQRLLTFDLLKKAIAGAIKTSCLTLTLVFAGQLMSIYLSNSGITRDVASFVIGLGLKPYQVLIILIIMYILMGMVMDTMTMMILTLPIVYPIVIGLGYNSVWFGIIMTMLSETGMITPPFGINLFILQGIRPEYPFIEIVKGCSYFFICIALVMILLIIFPQLVTFIPNMLIST